MHGISWILTSFNGMRMLTPTTTHSKEQSLHGTPAHATTGPPQVPWSCHEALKGIIDGYMLPSTALYHLRPMPSHSANARRLGLDLRDHSCSQITSRKLEFANSNRCPIGNMGLASKALKKAAMNIPSLSRKIKSLLEATDTPTQQCFAFLTLGASQSRHSGASLATSLPVLAGGSRYCT